MTRASALKREDGQVLVIFVVFIVVLLGMCAIVLDVGHAYLAQRRLQSSTDAAALAGAQLLPSPGNALNLANQYGNGGKNTPDGVNDVTMNVSTKCLASAPGCNPANAIVVNETGSVDTIFGGLFGIDKLNVHATATACAPCGSKPLDVMLVLDRTGSMCTKADGSDDHPACTDMQNARSGLTTFLSLMDPKLDNVGFAVLPPDQSSTDVCPFTVASPWYWSSSDNYVVAPLSNDYKVNGSPNPSSKLVQSISCVQPLGSTAYAQALESAQAELVRDGRPGVQKVIVFETDGAANIGPSTLPQSSPYRTTPCQQGVDSASVIKATNTLVYSIGYDVGHDVCQGLHKNSSGNWVSGNEVSAHNTPASALQAIATPGNYFNQPTASDLSNIYQAVAADLLAGTSRLIDDSAS